VPPNFSRFSAITARSSSAVAWMLATRSPSPPGEAPHQVRDLLADGVDLRHRLVEGDRRPARQDLVGPERRRVVRPGDQLEELVAEQPEVGDRGDRSPGQVHGLIELHRDPRLASDQADAVDLADPDAGDPHRGAIVEPDHRVELRLEALALGAEPLPILDLHDQVGEDHQTDRHEDADFDRLRHGESS
jgi:hypothetical protein